MMQEYSEKKVKFILETLEKLYPETPVPLNHSDPYTLLIAVLLSAQCTDARVNKVTPLLFQKAKDPYRMAELPVEVIKEIIKPCGLSNNKSKAISSLSQILISQYDGTVPRSLKELETLPGVGHKTASVVVSQAFGQAAFPVDTHIHRLLTRWGCTSGKNVKETENDAKRIFKKEIWNKLHLQIIYFGREYCPARGHEISICPICSRLDDF
jgi:endonuclease-3